MCFQASSEGIKKKTRKSFEKSLKLRPRKYCAFSRNNIESVKSTNYWYSNEVNGPTVQQSDNAKYKEPNTLCC